MADETKAPAGEGEDWLAEVRARAEAATPGPWAWAATCEKGYGANVGAECFAEDDDDARHPLSGDLSEREDNYIVLQGIASMEHQNANADAEFIAHAREDVPRLLAALARAEAENARAAEEGFKVAARLTARVEEAEARAARAEGEREEARREWASAVELWEREAVQVGNERDAARAEAARLWEALEELVAAMDRYEADACEEPPQRHRDMMTRARRALAGGAEGGTGGNDGK
jgi:hypothetical protein